MEAYDEAILDVIEEPTWVLRGYAGTRIAVQTLARGEYLHVVYKEVSEHDGFIITAFIARKYNKGMIIWSKNS